MVKFIKQKKMLYAGIISWLGIFILVSISCKSPTGPNAGTSVINITVSNECGVAVDVYMDGNFQFSIENLGNNILVNVSLGVHELEAKKKGTETLVVSFSVDIYETKEYEWTILSAARLTISNEYGETLSIFGDGDSLGDMDSPGTMIIHEIPYGEHLFEAKRPSDSTKVTSISIDFVENKEYLWTISK